MNIQRISSTQNNLIKFIVKLQQPKYRKSEKVILLDGEKTIEGLINDDVEFEYLFLKEEDELKNKAKAKNLIFVNDEILKKISTTKSPTSCVAVLNEPAVDKNIFKNLSKIALIDGIKDAGNLGTIIRSAVAFSIDGIILFGDCVDLYNTKTIRSTTQNIFKIPIIHTHDIEYIKTLKQNHVFVSTVVNSKNDFMKYDFPKKFIIAFGSEANGISEKIEEISDEKLTFSMDNNVESLNLGICASIAFAKIRYSIN